jgi:hypothetical protein
MSKPLLMLMIFVGSIVGGMVPGLWHAGVFSLWGIVFSGLGAIAGIFVALWISNNFLEV